MSLAKEMGTRNDFFKHLTLSTSLLMCGFGWIFLHHFSLVLNNLFWKVEYRFIMKERIYVLLSSG
ncbi:hypothetical protein [Cytobacillus praedii]|uniref:hypothetical protein n=1 Tax=Cytobacillus praedii TaxID=1742358 RepID=UPI002E1FA627|nr:hypothetical protein [Cytobacillus praedii]